MLLYDDTKQANVVGGKCVGRRRIVCIMLGLTHKRSQGPTLYRGRRCPRCPLSTDRIVRTYHLLPGCKEIPSDLNTGYPASKPTSVTWVGFCRGHKLQSGNQIESRCDGVFLNRPTLGDPPLEQRPPLKPPGRYRVSSANATSNDYQAHLTPEDSPYCGYRWV